MIDADGNECYGCIYKITNLQNEKCYIGKTVQEYEKYIESHFKKAVNKKDLKEDKKGKYLYNAIREEGRENFKWEILRFCYSEKELNDMEICFVSLFKSFGSDGITFDTVYGYNMTVGGDGFYKGHESWLKGQRGLLRYINDGTNNKAVQEEELHEYLETGWKIGRLNSKNNIDRIWINNGVKNTKVSQQNLHSYLDDGWKVGRTNGRFMKGRIKIINIKENNKEKRVVKEDLDKYLNEGWEVVTESTKKLLAHKYRNNAIKTGKDNPMSGRSVYSVWLEKYGKEEADLRLKKQAEKRSKTKRNNQKNRDKK
jgi:hypothetical protein